MFLDTAISQTAYAIEHLSSLAYIETNSQRFHTICLTLAKIRHEVAKKIATENIQIEHKRFILDSSSVNVCFDRISDNDLDIMELIEPKLREFGLLLYYQYVYNNIKATGRLLESCIDYFVKRSTNDLYKGNRICIDCGWVLDEDVYECKMCNGKSIERIDMI